NQLRSDWIPTIGIRSDSVIGIQQTETDPTEPDGLILTWEAVVPIRNNFGVMKSLYNLIEGSAKRHKDFEDIQKEVCLVPIPLKKLGNTRWTCRFESLKVILKQYSEIIADLQEMEVADAFIMLKVVQTFYFIFHIHLMSESFLITNILETIQILFGQFLILFP
ncbi:unnamed protein product, partial [Rotaria sp. Silwood2]